MAEERTYVVEVNEVETRLPDAARACELLERIAAGDAAEVLVTIDHGPRRQTWLGRVFGACDREIEPCFQLAKAGDVAVLTFLDAAWSEYRATDPCYPAQAAADQRMALSCGEPTVAPPEVCLQWARALAAAVEYLRCGERPHRLTYRYVR